MFYANCSIALRWRSKSRCFYITDNFQSWVIMLHLEGNLVTNDCLIGQNKRIDNEQDFNRSMLRVEKFNEIKCCLRYFRYYLL